MKNLVREIELGVCAAVLSFFEEIYARTGVFLCR